MKIAGRVERHTLDHKVIKTDTDAKRAMAEWVRNRRREIEMTRVGCHDMTLRELRDQWAEWANSPAGTLAPQTREGYAQRIDDYVLPILGADLEVASITPAHLRTMIDQLRTRRNDRGKPLADSTICGTVNAASPLFRLAVRRGVVSANPVRLERGDRSSQKR